MLPFEAVLRRLADTRRFKSVVKTILEDWVPPVLLETRWLNGWWIHLYNRKADLDFKRKALLLSDAEFAAAYAAVQTQRGSDWSDLDPSHVEFLIENLAPGTVLDVGAGCGLYAVEAARGGRRVTAVEMDSSRLGVIRDRGARCGVPVGVVGSRLEQLPFADQSFDNVVCAHVLEHVRDLHGSIRELLRVARTRVLVIVPQERYYRYTPNYHLHFFGGEEQLALAMGLKSYHAEIRLRCICYWADVTPTADPSGRRPGGRPSG
jgi:2-polyprenyl-3-methyl-5-hydroxy-6-metoxy-1,4-benzoquinol methylase